MEPVIFHGTPMTPRASLMEIAPGRAMCVSFWRPDDMEVVEAISPTIMFRQRRILGMARSTQAGGRMVSPRGLDAILSMAGASAIPSRQMGRDPGCPRRSFPAQRFTPSGMAIRGQRRTTVAHGCFNRAPAAVVRSISSRLHRMDGIGARGLRRLVPAYGRGCNGHGQSMARASYDARCAGGARVSLFQRRRDQRCAEWVAL